MSELDKVLIRLVQRLEKIGRRQEVGVVMQHLMVLQLDGTVEISNETMRLYVEALKGSVKSVDAFQKHVMEQYFHD